MLHKYRMNTWESPIIPHPTKRERTPVILSSVLHTGHWAIFFLRSSPHSSLVMLQIMHEELICKRHFTDSLANWLPARFSQWEVALQELQLWSWSSHSQAYCLKQRQRGRSTLLLSSCSLISIQCLYLTKSNWMPVSKGAGEMNFAISRDVNRKAMNRSESSQANSLLPCL